MMRLMEYNRLLSANLLRRKECHHPSEVGHHGIDGSGLGWGKRRGEDVEGREFHLEHRCWVVVSGFRDSSLVGMML